MQIAGCVQVPRSGSEPTPAPPERALAYFSAAVTWLATRTEFPVRVDPRPLRRDLLLTSVTEAHLLPGLDSIVRLRRDVVETAGWGVADAVADWRCVFSEGYPRGGPPGGAATDMLQAHRDSCRRNGRYESLVLSLPEVADEARPGRLRIVAMRMLLHGWEGVELFLEQDGVWHLAGSGRECAHRRLLVIVKGARRSEITVRALPCVTASTRGRHGNRAMHEIPPIQ